MPPFFVSPSEQIRRSNSNKRDLQLPSCDVHTKRPRDEREALAGNSGGTALCFKFDPYLTMFRHAGD